ncbi:MAG: hypothetical protein HY815_07875 [Candidatus Riflebacteria bacterium]|nr:hypothetical protein [Candidatus Riflebacteria bacterium]
MLAPVPELGQLVDVRKRRYVVADVTARVVPACLIEAPALVAHARLLVIGGTSHRLHEELITAGGLIRGDRFARMNRGELEAALTGAGFGEPGEAFERWAAGRWEQHRPSLEAASEQEERLRQEGIQLRLPSPEFSQPEEEQFRRNRDNLKTRLAAIPGEMAAEERAIRARFRDPVPRVFPVAVTYLVPANMVEGKVSW